VRESDPFFFCLFFFVSSALPFGRSETQFTNFFLSPPPQSDVELFFSPVWPSKTALLLGPALPEGKRFFFPSFDVPPCGEEQGM